ncbi:MAG: response regulator [Terriglobales bacterium]
MPTILCIDDDPKILELQQAVLEMNGYTVFIAPDGPTGITLASQHPVDVVVLDFKMPGMDGGQVAEALLKEHQDLPIVICTGFFDAVPEWLRWFAAAYLQKGDGPDVLLAAIRELVAKKPLPDGGGTSRSLHQAAIA